MAPSNPGTDALRNLLACMPPDERARIEVMECVKVRVIRTDERDGKVRRVLTSLMGDLVTRLNPTLPLGPGNRVEARALVLTGRTGAGKSSLLGRVVSANPAFPGYGVPGSGCRAVTVLTPSLCNPKALGLEICLRLGYPIAAPRTIPYIWAKVRERLETLGIFVLHLDEIHSVLETANDRELTQLRNGLKTCLVSQAWPVALVLSGHPEVVPFLEGPTESDEDGRPRADTKGELRRRSMFVDLPSLAPSDGPMLTGAVADVASVAGMTVPDDLEHVLIPRLIHASLREFSTAMQLVHEAIYVGLASNPRCGRLGTEQFKLAYEGRTGCEDAVNPFAAKRWREVDCRLVLKRSAEEEEAARLAERR